MIPKRFATAFPFTLLSAFNAAAQEMPLNVTASGNEPFWRVQITSDQFRLARPDFPPLIMSVVDRQTAADGSHTIVSATSSPALRAVLNLTPMPCADTMVDQTYPFTARLTLGDGVLDGCGGDPRDLLTSAETWTVTEIAGVAALPEPTLTIAFSETGAVSGSGGCNTYSAIYEITPEGLTFGPVASTRMACPGEIMPQEMAFFQALEGVFAFDITQDGGLVLNAAEGPVIRAEAN